MKNIRLSMLVFRGLERKKVGVRVKQVLFVVVSLAVFLMFASNTSAAESVHSNFAANTNSCGSCHTAHDGEGPGMLRWQSDFDACMGCHDGTANTYNVADGTFQASDGPDVKTTSGGLFGFSRDVNNVIIGGDNTPGTSSLSRHHVDSSLLLSSAPGGSQGTIKDDNGVWNLQFGCATCHDPHGNGGNSRLLYPDPNGLASAVYDSRVNRNQPYTLKPVVWNDYSLGFTVEDPAGGLGRIINNSMWSEKFRLFRQDPANNTYSIGNEYISVDNSSGYSVVKITDPQLAQGDQVLGYFVLVVKVDISVSNMLTSSETVVYKSGVNRFCGACHTDYETGSQTKPGQTLSGVYHEAFRHKVGAVLDEPVPGLGFEETLDGKYRLVCLTCHTAHGVNEAYWQRTLADKLPNWNQLDLKETGTSSTLKRMPNMGVCEACHQKGKGSQGMNY